ncbi:hypothetical protein [Gimibacter soli]|uniref:DUF429 domain-containing protein n=1 Tax=Gimibacter soli TaxID=3024400 RepID=A0AAE9XXR0_9PROT|nr:hypothetical protein [Gimibacter soli]WCL55659.1 hypothetical protein PH603_07810 [Gimibacter soli]
MNGFVRFVGIDWSGAKGARLKGLAVAEAAAGFASPVLAKPAGGGNWSREAIAAFISEDLTAREGRSIVGIDSAFSLPFEDKGLYLPGADLPEAALGLWAAIEAASPDPHFYGGGFVEAHRDHYHRAGGKGVAYERRLRVPEVLSIKAGHGPCESVFHLIGPSQVGMSGLSTIRMLHRLRGVPGIAIWPFDGPATIAEAKVVIVEIYCGAFARMGGHKGKFRTREHIDSALLTLNSYPLMGDHPPMDDNAADALVTAAGLRHIAHQPKYWNPPGLSDRVRATEGWIFGVI